MEQLLKISSNVCIGVLMLSRQTDYCSVCLDNIKTQIFEFICVFFALKGSKKCIYSIECILITGV